MNTQATTNQTIHHKDIQSLKLKEDILITKSPTAYRIWRYMNEQVDQTGVIVCSNVHLQKVLDISIMSISRSINLLKDLGLIDVKKVGNSNVYILNPLEKNQDLKGVTGVTAYVLFDK